MKRCERDREKMPEHLHRTYDDVVSWLYAGDIPKRSIRLDMCTACVESFDWIVKLIVNSPFCIEDFFKESVDGKGKKARKKKIGKGNCHRDCVRCIRGYAYKAIEAEKRAALAAEGSKEDSQ